QPYHAHRALPSFPTRRSSDLLRVLGRAGSERDRPDRERQGPHQVTPTGAPTQDPSLRPRLVAFEPPEHFRHARDGTRVREEQGRSEEHTSELQSLTNLVCRLL